jgi:hypothetical protein
MADFVDQYSDSGKEPRAKAQIGKVLRVVKSDFLRPRLGELGYELGGGGGRESTILFAVIQLFPGEKEGPCTLAVYLRGPEARAIAIVPGSVEAWEDKIKGVR